MIVKVNMIVVVTLVTPHNCVDGEIDGLSLNTILSFFTRADLVVLKSGLKCGSTQTLCSRQHLRVLSL